MCIRDRFIASDEAGVSDAYKQEVVKSGMEDIVMTERLSGTPCTIINTPLSLIHISEPTRPY